MTVADAGIVEDDVLYLEQGNNSVRKSVFRFFYF